MELALQMGFGSMSLARELTSERDGMLSIMSPRDFTSDQLSRLSRALHASDGKTWLDPQFYLPHADHHRLVDHTYWPANYDTESFWAGGELSRLIDQVLEVNDELA